MILFFIRYVCNLFITEIFRNALTTEKKMLDVIIKTKQAALNKNTITPLGLDFVIS